jgi:hypothetical protein
MIEQKIIAPNCYLPSVAYMAFLLNSKNFVVEAHENFVKSTERNRAYIAGTNAALMLSVPVEGGKGHRQLYKDTKISHEFRWQKIHWQTLCSCYRRSAYFEYYEEKLAPFYNKKFDFLFDYNTQLLHTILEMLKTEVVVSFTENYEKEYDDETVDLRGYFKNSKDCEVEKFQFLPPTYFQCFEKNTGFLENLSVLDILFSEGSTAKSLIANSLK